MSKAEVISLLSVVAASAAVLITLANFSVARANLALALFDRRMAVYQSVRTAVSLAIVSEDEFVEKDGLRHLHKAINEGRFLFGPEVSEYLTSLWKAGTQIQIFHKDIDKRATNAYNDAYRLLVDGTVKLQSLVDPYMAMDHKLPWRPIRKLFG